MKNFILALGMFSAMVSFAQDTIFTRSGEVIPAKVYEITPTEIKYKKPSNPDGPMYVTSKENVTLIEYKNGSKDVFQQTAVDDVYNNSNQGNQNQDNTVSRQRSVNVVVAPPSIVIGRSWGYRPYRYHRHRSWRWGCGWWW